MANKKSVGQSDNSLKTLSSCVILPDPNIKISPEDAELIDALFRWREDSKKSLAHKIIR